MRTVRPVRSWLGAMIGGLLMVLVGSAPTDGAAAPPVPLLDDDEEQSEANVLDPDRRNLHTIRLGVGYQPGPGSRIFANYIYGGIPSGDIDVVFGWGGQLFGSLGYTHRFTLAPRRALIVSTTGFSYFEPDRILDGEGLDERRTGIRSRATVRQRPADLWQRSAYAEAGFSRIWLNFDELPNAFRDLTTLELGGEASRVGRPSFVRPDLIGGVLARGGLRHAEDTAFIRTALAARWHPELGSGFSLDFDGRLEWASLNTPSFERPSFGGFVGVRGFRPDVTIGRALGVMQSEIWVPLPGTIGATGGFPALLGRHVRLAAFADVGGVDLTEDPNAAAIRSGFGLGVRLRLGGLTLQVDWAHRGSDLRDGRLQGDIFVGVRPDGMLFLFDRFR